jgi:hypothetical protein
MSYYEDYPMHRDDVNRLKRVFGNDTRRSRQAFDRWKDSLSDAAKASLSRHDMGRLNEALLETQLETCFRVEATIAKSLDEICFQPRTEYPWSHPDAV